MESSSLAFELSSFLQVVQEKWKGWNFSLLRYKTSPSMGFLQRAHMFLYFSASKIRQQIPQKQGGKERKVHKNDREKKKNKFLLPSCFSFAAQLLQYGLPNSLTNELPANCCPHSSQVKCSGCHLRSSPLIHLPIIFSPHLTQRLPKSTW